MKPDTKGAILVSLVLIGLVLYSATGYWRASSVSPPRQGASAAQQQQADGQGAGENPGTNEQAANPQNQESDKTGAVQQRPKATKAEWAIAALTAVIIWIAFQHGRIMQSQIAQTQQTLELMRRDQRPWISIARTESKSGGFPSANRFQVELVNTGKTPALKVSIGIAMKRAAKEVFDAAAYSRDPSNFMEVARDIVIPPSGQRTLSVHPKAHLDTSYMDGLVESGELIFLIIRIRYSDTADTQYGTDHGGSWHPISGSFRVDLGLDDMY